MTTRQLFTLASLALLLLAAATGCTDDHSDANEPAQTGLPVDFASIRIAASANGGSGAGSMPTTDAGGFYPGDVIRARLLHDGTTQKAVLTNIGTAGTPKWEADTPVYWQSTTTGHTLTLNRGAEGNFTLPDDMNETTSVSATGSGATTIPNYSLHDRLFYTRTDLLPGTPIACELEHCMAQIVVTLKRDPASKLPTDDDLLAARVSMELPAEGHFDGTTGDVTQRNTGTAGTSAKKPVKFLKGDEQAGVHSHFAVALPGGTGTQVITITIPTESSSTRNEQKYQYTATEPITLEAGSSRIFHLSVGARVSAISIDAKDWQKVEQGPGVGEWLIIKDVTPGKLANRLPKKTGNYNKISVRGRLNGDDYWALKAFLDNLPSPVSLEIEITGESGSIPYEAFRDCKKLGAVALKGIESIKDAVFMNSSLTSITLPDGLTGISQQAFGGCEGLKSITLPSSVTYLRQQAFAGCTNLASVSLPERLMQIDSDAFADCISLKSIDLPSSVKTWGRGIFSYSGLTSIALPEGMTTIPSNTFEGCGSLQTITLPSTIKVVGDYAFKGSSLTSITLPDGLTGISQQAFAGCQGLKSITLPSSVKSLGWSAFHSCTNLASVSLPKGLEYIGYNAFSNCTSLKSITLPSSVTTWGTSIFQSSGLTSIALPEGMTEIPSNTFEDCGSLQTITLHSTITTVGNNAFLRSGLTSIILPEGLETIGYQAFAKCAQLQKVAIYDYPKFGTDAFKDTPDTKQLFDYSDIAVDTTTINPILGTNWQTIYYNYKGTGDKLDPNSYSLSK